MICKELNVSRTPVREALIQLASEGVLESLPRRGFVVREIDVKTSRDLYQIIGPLDALAAESALPYLGTKEFKKMKRLIEDIDEAIEENDFNRYYQLQLYFHDVYIDLCRNTELIHLLKRLRKIFIKQGFESDDRLVKILYETNDEHKKLLELFTAKDVDSLKEYLVKVHWNPENAVFDAVPQVR